jgi:hypothetical protein
VPPFPRLIHGFLLLGLLCGDDLSLSFLLHLHPATTFLASAWFRLGPNSERYILLLLVPLDLIRSETRAAAEPRLLPCLIQLAHPRNISSSQPPVASVHAFAFSIHLSSRRTTSHYLTFILASPLHLLRPRFSRPRPALACPVSSRACFLSHRTRSTTSRDRARLLPPLIGRLISLPRPVDPDSKPSPSLLISISPLLSTFPVALRALPLSSRNVIRLSVTRPSAQQTLSSWVRLPTASSPPHALLLSLPLPNGLRHVLLFYVRRTHLSQRGSRL